MAEGLSTTYVWPTMNWHTTDLCKEWERFYQHCKFAFGGPLRKCSEKEKICNLMNFVGDKGREMYMTFEWGNVQIAEDQPEVSEKDVLEQVVAKFHDTSGLNRKTVLKLLKGYYTDTTKAGVGESLKGAGTLGIITLILAVVGNICSWIAFTTAAWARSFNFAAGVSDFYTGYGLWRVCGGGGTTDALVGSCAFLDGTNVAHYGAVQAMASIGFLGFNVVCLILFLKVFTSMCSSVGDIDKVNAITAIATGVIYLVGVVIFGVEYGDGEKTRNGFGRDGDLGYSFIFAIFAVVLEIVTGVLILVPSMKGGAVGSK